MYFIVVMDIEILDGVVAIEVSYVIAKELHSIARKHYLLDVQVQMEIISRIAYLVYSNMDSCVPSYN